mgnify:CR=1 FL=1
MNFKLFKGELIEFNSFMFRQEIIDTIYTFCNEYISYIKECQDSYLKDHPDVDPNGIYAYPIPYKEIEKQFQEGRLYHSGRDLWEDDRLIHSVFLDLPDESYYYFEVDETDEGSLRIKNVVYDCE